MRLLVSGGREYGDYATLYRELKAIWLAAPHGTMLVIQGGATGADALARKWCMENFVDYKNYPADWEQYGRGAGPIRNQRMIDHGKPDILIAFPGGRGTEDMIRRAEKAGIPVKRVAP